MTQSWLKHDASSMLDLSTAKTRKIKYLSLNPNYGKGRLDRPITGSRIVQADLVGPIEIPLI
jgi:hypothetical protein